MKVEGWRGCIIIKRLNQKRGKNLLDTINERIGDSITNDKAVQIIEGLQQSNLITDREAAIIKVTVNDRTLYGYENRNALRADLLKAIMMILCHQ